MKKPLFILIFILCNQAQSQNRVGNGADVVVCQPVNEKKTLASTSLLDFYEEANFIDFKTVEKSPWLIVKERLNALQNVAPKLGQQYLERLQTIKNEFDFKNEIDLVDVKDSNHLFVGDNCTLQQIVIRKKLTTDKEFRFIVSKKHWDLLSPLHQAGVISHEIVYEHFYKLGELDSVKARKINRKLYVDKLSKKNFWAAITDLEIPVYP